MIGSRRRPAADESPPPEAHLDAPEDARTGVEEQPEDPGWRPGRIWRLLVLTALLLLGVGYLGAAWQLEVGTVEQPDIGVYPRAAGVLFVLCLAPVLVRELRTPAGAEPDAGTPDGEAPAGAESSPRPWAKPMAVLGAVLFYVLSVRLLGHIVSGAVVMAIVLRVAGQRAWWKVLGISALCSVSAYALIAVVLGLPLPTGRLGLEF